MARESPLDLTFIINTSKIDQNDFFELAGAKVSQWRSLVVETRFWEAALMHLQTHKPPRLETLHLTGCHRPDVEDEIVSSGGGPLKDIWSTTARVHRASLHLSNLKSLHLSGIPSITVTEIIAILQQSSDLELLRLDSLEGAVMPTEPTGGLPNLAFHSPIQLPFLIKLHLSDLSFPFLNFLLSTLAFSQLRTLNIICHVDEQSSIRSGICRLNPTLFPATSDAQTYKVTLATWCYYSISIGGLCIIVTFPDRLSMDQFDETFTWLGDRLGVTLAEIPLHLVLNDCNPELSYLEWFTHRTNVTNLTLSANAFFGSGLEDIIPFLGKQTPSPSSAWLLPQLEVFKTNLVHPQSKDQIADMIQRRQSVRPASLIGLPVAWPKRFCEIWLADGGREYPAPQVNEDFLLKVVRAAEGADVYWEGKKWVGSNNLFSENVREIYT
ncbi:hypothetical protein FS837_000698 [Tulasnella sp. UAMH 9824]|nr:hypothetical protein FS837_000698 [Tulasnella sp. UAMH 9824]